MNDAVKHANNDFVDLSSVLKVDKATHYQGRDGKSYKCAGGGCKDIDIYTGHDHAAALAGGITTVEIFDQRC